MRTHHLYHQSNNLVSGCKTTDGSLCNNTERNSLQLDVSHSVTSCTFNSISSSVLSGGVLYIHYEGTSETSLTVQSCMFFFCNTTTEFSAGYGGGAIYMDSGTLLSVTSSTFISCSTKSYGGAIYSKLNCKACIVSQSSFISCSSDHGAGLMSYHGPTLSVSSSQFVSCIVTRFGCGIYHDSTISSSNFRLTDSLFTGNQAKSGTNNTRGGGAFEDYRATTYRSTYLFSYFTGNTAPYGKGYDISIQINALSNSPVTHCLTTTPPQQSFWNYRSYVNNWLLLSIMNMGIPQNYTLYTVRYPLLWAHR